MKRLLQSLWGSYAAWLSVGMALGAWLLPPRSVLQMLCSAGVAIVIGSIAIAVLVAGFACAFALLARNKRKTPHIGTDGDRSGRFAGVMGTPITRFFEDIGHSTDRVKLALACPAVVLAIVAAKTFEGHEFYIYEPGLDDGFVHARVYSWWGLSDEHYDLKSEARDDGSGGWQRQWYVRKSSPKGRPIWLDDKSNPNWVGLFGPDENGNPGMLFPR